MSDIVERLRATERTYASGFPGRYIEVQPTPLCLEAADAIDRLIRERDEALSMLKGREALQAANLGVDFDKVAILTARDMATRALAAEAQLERLTSALRAEQTDAERWRALMASQKMHWMGSAGFEHAPIDGAEPTSRALEDQNATPRPGETWHFGMEFWFGIPADPRYPSSFERRVMVAYVDAIRDASNRGDPLQ